jgi:hypothetical protein
MGKSTVRPAIGKMGDTGPQRLRATETPSVAGGEGRATLKNGSTAEYKFKQRLTI